MPYRILAAPEDPTKIPLSKLHSIPRAISPACLLDTMPQLGVGKLADGEGPAVLLPRPVVGTFSKPLTATALTTPSPAADGKSTGTSSPPPNQTPVDAAAAAGTGTGTGAGTGGVSGAAPPAFLAARAACGQSHTVLVSTAGEVWSTGRNRSGQLGVNPEEVAETPSPVTVPLLLPDDGRPTAEEGSGGGVTAPAVAVQAAAGRAHTLLLLSDGRVVGFGSDEFGALGAPAPSTSAAGAAGAAGGGADSSSMEVDDPPPLPPSYHWRPTVVEELKGQWITSVSAGGEQSLALAVDTGPAAAESAAASPPRPPAAAAEQGTAASTGVPVHAALSAEEHESTAASAATAPPPTPTPTASPASPSTRAAAVLPAGVGGGGSVGEGGVPFSRQGSEAMFLRRRFSLPPAPRMRTVGEFMQLIQRAAAAGVGKEAEGGGEGEGPQGLAEEAAVLEVGRYWLRKTCAVCTKLSSCVFA